MPDEAPFHATEICYAGYPAVPLYDTRESRKQSKQLLWGDWITVVEDESDGWVKVRVRGSRGWVPSKNLQRERLLEIVFVDIGQGDGALVVTPQDEALIVDAGESDNMYRFLRWRFGRFDRPFRFKAGVMTHPDMDHYKGFGPLLKDVGIQFEALYHNGIMEDTSVDGLGAHLEIDGRRYIDELMTDRAALDAFLSDTSRWQTTSADGRPSKKLYASLLNTAATSGRVDSIQMLTTEAGASTFMPGFGLENPVRIQVLGSLLETCSDGVRRLRWFPYRAHGGSLDRGVTKNGHSVVLRLQYGGVSVLFGGDLNSSSETFMMQQYAGLAQPPRNADERQEMIRRAGLVFGVDIAKCCHHGSADFIDEFLTGVHPAATVVSSGDQESHAHPRSDTLGAIGVHGRGSRPLIFSTELARSARESADPKARKEVRDLQAQIDGAATERERAELRRKYNEVLDGILDRFVAVYGAINLRTDGEKALLAYKLESPRAIGQTVANWDIYRMEPDANGQLAYVRPDQPVRRPPRDEAEI